MSGKRDEKCCLPELGWMADVHSKFDAGSQLSTAGSEYSRIDDSKSRISDLLLSTVLGVN